MTGHDLMSAMPMIVWEIRRHGTGQVVHVCGCNAADYPNDGLSRCPYPQISSPSGKALFQWVANETSQVDFYICALSFGKNDLGERQRIGATVSIYLNGTFVWCALSSAVLQACTRRRCRPSCAVWLAAAGLLSMKPDLTPCTGLPKASWLE